MSGCLSVAGFVCEGRTTSGLLLFPIDVKSE